MGSYPNRGIMQYAQIINPLTVVPTWWYDYPILRPYGGQQYVGFTRTSSGNANDENNFEAQPIAPQKEQIKAQKKFSLDLAPYSFVMLEYSL